MKNEETKELINNDREKIDNFVKQKIYSNTLFTSEGNVTFDHYLLIKLSLFADKFQKEKDKACELGFEFIQKDTVVKKGNEEFLTNIGLRAKFK